MKEYVALVTGGTGGIGTAICRKLHDLGVKVAAGYNNAGVDNKAVAWQKAQEEQGYNFHISYADVSNYESVGGMIADIEETLGPISIVVNNAGITRDAQLKKMDVSMWDIVLRVNLDSVFNVTRQVINGMIDRNYGRIINISSINGQKGQFGQANYSAAKAGMHGFSKALAQEVAGKGITVNTVSPGYVGTEMVRQMRPEIVEKIVAQIPVGRLAGPEEIADIVAFLAAESSGFITGSNIAINGGQHMF